MFGRSLTIGSLCVAHGLMTTSAASCADGHRHAAGHGERYHRRASCPVPRWSSATSRPGRAATSSTTELGFYARAVPADRPLHGHRHPRRLRDGGSRGHRRRPQPDARRRFRDAAVDARRDGHGAGRGAADQHQQRRGEEHADRRADHRQADAQPRQLPVAGRDLPGLPGQPDVRAEQPDRLVGLVDQLQRHRLARRDVPDQRRQQRRLVGEPEPAGGGAVDDQGVPGHQQHLQRRVRPRLRRGGAGADQVGHQPVARRPLRVHAGRQRPDGPPQVHRRQARQPAPSVRRHRWASRSGRTGCSASSAPIAPSSTASRTTPATCCCPASARRG